MYLSLYSLDKHKRLKNRLSSAKYFSIFDIKLIVFNNDEIFKCIIPIIEFLIKVFEKYQPNTSSKNVF